MKPCKLWKQAISLMSAAALTLSVNTIPAAAAYTPVLEAPAIFASLTNDGGADRISLSNPRSFQAVVPVDLTAEEAEQLAASVVWTLLPDEDAPAYLDDALYPFQTKGGPLSGWMCKDGETPFFTDVATEAVTADGQTCLQVNFKTQCYFLDDLSVPHVNGGYYMDVCGNFQLTAQQDGKTLGSVPLQILPYDKFSTMDEIYAKLDDAVTFAKENTGLYVEKFSMGMSQGDNGMKSLDMPYLIVAKDKAAVAKWKAIQAEAETDPTALLAKLEAGALGDFQVPVMYSNVHSNEVAATDGIMVFLDMLLQAAAGDGQLSYNTLTGFTEAGKAELAAQMGPVGKEGSVAIPDLVEDTASYLGWLKGKKADGTLSHTSIAVDMDEYYTQEVKTVQLDELLNDVFFILVPEENVEGRVYLTRTSSGGYDLNRDNSFQTQAETQNMAHLIAQWNPVSLVEFHGRIRAFQCEPCDPPHEPNFEYDLLAGHLMGGGEALGIAAVANNTAHNSYVIPQRDYLTYTGKTAEDGGHQTIWADPWDDMSTSYTPQYAMLHGTVSYTVESPAYDSHMVDALAYGQLGQSAYIAENKESYLKNQTEIFERGVTNANSDGYDQVGQWFADQHDVEGAEAELFRPEYDGEGENGNFYPECYIIPMDAEHQVNLQAAADMLIYLTRNGVKVELADSAFTYDGTEYPAGTAVVSMYQAKRSVANGVLYDGTVITGWSVLYSEGITAFDKTRGFDMAVCAKPEAYQEIKQACGKTLDYAAAQDYTGALDAQFSGVKNQQTVLMNSSEAAAAAVNELLKSGKQVSLITEGAYKGSFLCSYKDWQSAAKDHLITGVGVEEAPAAKPIEKAPVLYICGKPGPAAKGFIQTKLVSGSYTYNYDRQAMESMGFAVTEDPNAADLIIGASMPNETELAVIKQGKPYIGYGSKAVKSAAALFGEGQLVRLTAGDNAMDALAHVTYPTDSPVTASYVAEGDDVLYGYGAGYFAQIPAGSQVLVQLDGSKPLMEGFLPEGGEHMKDFLNDSVQAIAYEGKGADNARLDVVLFANTLTNKTHQKDEYAFISNTAFSQLTEKDAPALRQDAVAGLYELAGKPEAEAASFTDVGAELAPAVSWAFRKKITNGVSAASFAPEAELTLEQAVTMLYRFAGAETDGKADPASCVTPASAFAEKAMAWALESGLLEGKVYPRSTLTQTQLSALLKAVQ